MNKKEKFTVLILVVFVTISAFSVVLVRHNIRLHFTELHELAKERDELRAEWARLQLGYGVFGTQGHIEYLARSQLNMQRPELEKTRIIIYAQQ